MGYAVICYVILRACSHIAQGDVPLDTFNKIIYVRIIYLRQSRIRTFIDFN